MVLVVAATALIAGVGIPVAGVIAKRSTDPTNRTAIGMSCAGPQLQLAEDKSAETVAPATTSVRAGQALTVTGRYYTDGCQDTNHAPTPRPLKVSIVLRGHGRTVLLRTVQAHGELGTFRATVRLPADYPAGTTSITTRTVGQQAELAAGLPTQPIRLTITR